MRGQGRGNDEHPENQDEWQETWVLARVHVAPPGLSRGICSVYLTPFTRFALCNSPSEVRRLASDAAEKPNVTPSVNCQSGPPPANRRRTPASNHTFLDDQGCQMTPRSAELRCSSRRGFSPLISPTTRTPLATGSSPITPQIPTRS